MSENLCIRCGKVRILARAWKEKVISYGQVSYIECSQMVCPDKDCQVLVEKDLAAQRKKTAEITRNKEIREAAHKSRIVDLRLSRIKK